MIRTAIISLAGLLCGGATIAQSAISDSYPLAFADRHLAFLAERCSSDIAAFEMLSENELQKVFVSIPDGLPEGIELDELTVLDVHFGSLVAVNAMAIAESLKFMGLFRADASVDEIGFGETYNVSKARAEAVLALSKCVWPSIDERSNLAESRWADPFARIASGVCDIHFFTMAQRYIDTPIVHMTPAERQIAGDKLTAEHDQYLKASKDPSKCGEFL